MTAIKHACELMRSNFSSDPSLGTRLPTGRGSLHWHRSHYGLQLAWGFSKC